MSPFRLKVNNTKEPSDLQAVNQPENETKADPTDRNVPDGATHNVNFLLPVLTVSDKPTSSGFLFQASNRVLTELKLIFLRVIKSCKVKNNSFFISSLSFYIIPEFGAQINHKT